MRPFLDGGRADSTLEETYEASVESLYVYERLYDLDAADIGLDPEVLEIIGHTDPSEAVVPEMHFHIEKFKFLAGFAAREDLTQMVDHLAARFGVALNADYGIMIMDGRAIPGMDPTTGHGLVEAGSLMDGLGFTYRDEVFVLRSMSDDVEIARLQRFHDADTAEIKRTPL